MGKGGGVRTLSLSALEQERPGNVCISVSVFL